MSKNKHKAFTFIELLIAFTIFSIIASSIYYTLHSGMKFYSKGNSLIKNNQQLRIFFDTLTADLRNAVDYHPYIEAEWSNNSITFSSIINIFNKGSFNRELVKLSYFLEQGKLVRRCATSREGLQQEKAKGQPLLEEVKSLNFEYCYQAEGLGGWQWIDQWQSGENDPLMPKGIRVKLTLKQQGQQSSESFIKTVFIPLGKLGSKIGG